MQAFEYKLSRVISRALDDEVAARIHLVDSANLSTGIGLLVYKACKFRDEGFSAKAVYVGGIMY